MSYQFFDELLPYPSWRQGQRELTLELYKALVNRKIVLLNAPTGYGKTLPLILASLKAALDTGKRVLYVARTKSEFMPPLRELERIKGKVSADTAFLYSFLKNKKEMCILSSINRYEYEIFLEKCNLLKELNKCKYYINSLDKCLDDLRKYYSLISDFEAFVNYCKKTEVCPYEIARKIGENALFLVCTYPYLFHSITRNSLLSSIGLKLEDLIVIIDEAHSLPGYLLDLYSFSIDLSMITRTKKEVREYLDASVAQDVLTALRAIEFLLADFSTKREMTSIFYPNSRGELIKRSLLNTYSRLESAKRYVYIVSRRKASEEASESELLKLFRILRELHDKREFYVVDLAEENSIHLKCALPGVYTSDIFKRIHSGVLTSGTLPHTDYLVYVLDIPAQRLHEIKIPYPKRLHTVIATNVTTRYTDRSEEMFSQIADCIIITLKAVESTLSEKKKVIVLCVVPSYQILKKILLKLVKRGIKYIVFEREGEDIEKIKERIQNKLDAFNILLLLAVASGKISEGVEITDKNGRNLIRAVIMAGLPYPEPHLTLKYLRNHLVKRLRNPEKAWRIVFEEPAIMRVLQAAGRATRNLQDEALLIILDKRATKKENLETISEISKVVKIVRDQSELNAVISTLLSSNPSLLN